MVMMRKTKLFTNVFVISLCDHRIITVRCTGYSLYSQHFFLWQALGDFCWSLVVRVCGLFVSFRMLKEVGAAAVRSENRSTRYCRRWQGGEHTATSRFIVRDLDAEA